MAPLPIRLRIPGSPAPSDPTPPTERPAKDPTHTPTSSDSGSEPDSDIPPLPYDLQHPAFHLRFEHFTHPAIPRLLAVPSLATLPTEAWKSIAGLLYPSAPGPVVRSVTIKFRPCGGVAATSGLFLDDEFHKKIVFSLDYLNGIKGDDDFAWEVTGVLVHELVHTCQYARGCPGGLVEGVADYVRLKAGVPNRHWRRSGGKDPFAGYSTTAYFLEWVEGMFEGSVERINGAMKECEWREEVFEEVTGVGLKELWENYKESYELN